MNKEPLHTPLQSAAQAVLDHWDGPTGDWGKQGPIAELIHALRSAVDDQKAIRVTRIELTATQREGLRCKRDVKIPGAFKR